MQGESRTEAKRRQWNGGREEVKEAREMKRKEKKKGGWKCKGNEYLERIGREEREGKERRQKRGRGRNGR